MRKMTIWRVKCFAKVAHNIVKPWPNSESKPKFGLRSQECNNLLHSVYNLLHKSV